MGKNNLKVTSQSHKVLGLIIVLLFLMTLSGCRLSEEKGKIESYLRDEYGKPFVVEKTYYTGGLLGEPLTIHGIAYPKDDKDLKFDIERFAYLKYAGHSEYFENYFRCLWGKQIREKIKPIFGEDLFLTEVSAPIVKISQEIHGKTISIDDDLKIYGPETNLFIEYVVFIDHNYYFSHMLIVNNLEENGIYNKINKLKK